MTENTEQRLDTCRSCRDEIERSHGFRHSIGIPKADVIVWGKLFPKENLGPRCLLHYTTENPNAKIEGYAVFDLRGLQRVQ
jgi:hypothetical protein